MIDNGLDFQGLSHYTVKLTEDIESRISEVGKSGSYNDLIDKPTIGNGTITITQNGTTKGTFSTNQNGDTTIALSDTDTNTTYSAGTGISLSGTTFSNSGVRSIAAGTNNGTISVNTNGTTANVAVKGLGSAAYTNSTAYDASGLAETKANAALSSAKSYTDEKINAIIGEGASETLDTIGEIASAIEDNQDMIATLNSAIGNKVDKVTGKGLSTNDYTTAEKTKLSGIATGAQVNQNAFSNVVVGSTTVAADSATDTLTLVGSNVTLTPDATNDTVTIGITKTNVTSALGYTPPTTNTTYSTATSSANGLMSSTDKEKLDAITASADAVSFTRSLTSGTKVGTITINGTGTDLYAPTNTDTKVTQTVTTANASYPLLLAPSGQTATATTTSYFDSGVTLNPSTNTIVANISGNSATATKLATARTIALTGSVTGSGTFDGSGNLSIATTTNHTHSYAGSSSAGGDATNALKLSGYSASSSAIGSTVALRNSSGYLFATYFNQSSSAETPTTSSYIMYVNSDGYLRKSTLANIKTILGLGSAAYTASTAYAAASHTHSYLALSGGTLTGALSGTTGTFSGRVTANGRITTTSSAGSWISGMTLTNASLGISTQQTTSSYHPYFAVKTSGGHVFNLGGLGDKVGFYGYKSDRTENGTDWSFVVNASTGAVVSTGTITAPTFIGSLSGTATNATTATKLGSATVGSTSKPIYLNSGTATACSATVGSATQPVYMSSGTITACTYTLAKSVPSNAVFTDTHYTTGLIVGASNTATVNATASNGSVYLNLMDNTTIRNSHKIVGSGSVTVTSDSSGNITITGTASTTDTKNTAGSTDSSSKLFLIGATSQAANPQTYSQDTVYVGTDGHLYSNSKQVVNLSDTQALTNKTYNGYTLAAACAKAVTDSSSASAISTGTSLVTERDVYYGLPTINGSHAYTSSTTLFAPTSVGTSGYVLKSGGSGAPSWVAQSSIAAGTASTLATARTINGTSFNGSANITTANWGTARTLTIGAKGKSVNGSAAVSWTLAEIGAMASSHEVLSTTEPTTQSSGDYWLCDY